MDDAILSLVDKYNGYGIALFTLITIFVAGVLSSFFGLERELRGQSAGLRTHVLLSVGSSLMMTISIYAIRAAGVEFDAARIGAAVVGGIGFIGAGCIFKIGFNVKGLTTGATLWMCGGIGLACGSGFVLEAIIATVIALFFLIGLVYVEKIIDKRAPQVKIFCKSDIPILSLIHQKADENNLIIKTKKAIWMTRYPINLQHVYFIRLLQEREHISYQSIQSNSNSVLDLTTNYSKRLVDNQHCLVIDQLAKKTWYGQDTKALRKLPYIGKINDYEYVSYGYDKWGMTLSHVASKIIYDLIVYQDSKYASLYAIGNGNYLHAGSDIVKLIKNNYHGMIKNRIFVAKDVKLKAGEGKVVRHRGRLLAIYRDFDDRVFYMSPYCPHLKCVVEFNLQDQTWCCPCHGSIYNCYGKLLNGPATSSLKKSKPG